MMIANELWCVTTRVPTHLLCQSTEVSNSNFTASVTATPECQATERAERQAATTTTKKKSREKQQQ